MFVGTGGQVEKEKGNTDLFFVSGNKKLLKQFDFLQFCCSENVYIKEESVIPTDFNILHIFILLFGPTTSHSTIGIIIVFCRGWTLFFPITFVCFLFNDFHRIPDGISFRLLALNLSCHRVSNSLGGVLVEMFCFIRSIQDLMFILNLLWPQTANAKHFHKSQHNVHYLCGCITMCEMDAMVKNV